MNLCECSGNYAAKLGQSAVMMNMNFVILLWHVAVDLMGVVSWVCWVGMKT